MLHRIPWHGIPFLFHRVPTCPHKIESWSSEMIAYASSLIVKEKWPPRHNDCPTEIGVAAGGT
jgi:hypothetical protein